MPDIGFVNGQFMPLGEAMVSIEDRGYQFGDGVYEVIRTYGGVTYQLEAHLERLARSARALDITEPYGAAKWTQYISHGIELAGYRESKVYVQLTRGVAPRDHVYPVSSAPSAVMSIREMHPLSPALSADGVLAVTLPDLRWARCDIKTINLLPNLLARQQAKVRGAFEAILYRAAEVTEGAVSNVMMVREGVVKTPPQSSWILSGVTRTVVLDLARKNGIGVKEEQIACDELRAADEIFLTGTTVEVLPVVKLDGKLVGDGTRGPFTARLQTLFRAALG